VYSICRRGSSPFEMDTRRLMDTKQNTMKCQLAFIVVLILARPSLQARPVTLRVALFSSSHPSSRTVNTFGILKFHLQAQW
jgi:hypothetical protein